MSITILSTPYGTSTPRVNPTTNGLPFVVNSTFKDRENFKYICDIYDGTTKVARLKHNPDLSTKYGIFDAGKILQNTFPIANTHLASYGTGFWNSLPNLFRKYTVKFGEEYSRRGTYTSVTSLGGFARFYTPSLHNLRVGDRIFTQNLTGTTTQYNNKYSTVTSVTSNNFVTNIPYIAGGNTGYFVEGEGFYDNWGWNDSDGVFKVGFIIPVTRPTRILVGDTVFVKQDAGATNPGYDGEWLVKKITTITTGGITYTHICTDCPFISSTPAQGGAIISKSSYVFNDLTTNAADNAYHFDGAIQYRDYPTWSVTPYMLDGITKKFLTNSPRTLDIKSTDYQTLSLFRLSTVLNRVYYKWYPVSTQITGTLSTVSTFARITLTGNYSTYFRASDVISLNGTATTVTSSTYSAGFTTVITPLVATVSGSGSIDLVSREFIQVYPVGTYWAGQYRMDLQVGLPLQANYATNFPVQPLGTYTIQAYNGTSPVSELFTYNVVDDCQDWTTYRFVWLNPLGGWDYFEYKGRGEANKKINRLEYDRRLESFNSSTNKWNYKVGDRGSRVYGVSSNEEVTATSGYINYETANWLMELYDSPEVYVMEGTQLIPIVLTSDEVNAPRIKKVGINNLTIKFKWSFNKNIQQF
jgi:hypothetical protein